MVSTRQVPAVGSDYYCRSSFVQKDLATRIRKKIRHSLGNIFGSVDIICVLVYII